MGLIGLVSFFKGGIGFKVGFSSSIIFIVFLKFFSFLILGKISFSRLVSCDNVSKVGFFSLSILVLGSSS